MNTKRFQRKIENFTCLKCAGEVIGNGYTNHCPNCLWSKHVDINPGDRSESCRGEMEPYTAELVSGEVVITHRCLKCGLTRRNKVSPEDSQSALEHLLMLSQGS